MKYHTKTARAAAAARLPTGAAAGAAFVLSFIEFPRPLIYVWSPGTSTPYRNYAPLPLFSHLQYLALPAPFKGTATGKQTCVLQRHIFDLLVARSEKCFVKGRDVTFVKKIVLSPWARRRSRSRSSCTRTASIYCARRMFRCC